jgi:threonine dehydratase/predicted amino acid-binding ACT domain protein
VLIQPALVRTPTRHSRTLSGIAGCEVWLKFENRQFTASFKERGALNRLLALTPDERVRGVAAMSAGNHAQGVAYHAGRLGIPATIVMPLATPFTKVKHTRDFGARVILEGEDLNAANAAARAIAEADSLTFIHPYDDARVIAGQGTVALEMLEDVPDLDALVVREAMIEHGLAMLLEVEKTLVEGAAAAGLAALLANPAQFAGRKVGVVMSGGNIDMRLLSNVILRELGREGRIMSLELEIEDRPGLLAQISTIVGDCGGNILEVSHNRMMTGIPVKSATLGMVVEARDAEHGQEIRDRLAAKGFIQIGGNKL